VMNKGRIEDVGTPASIYMRPRSLFSAGFMGEVNLLPAKICGTAANEAEVETVLGRVALPASAFVFGFPVAGRDVTLCIRPEHFRSANAASPTVSLGRGRITGSAFFGTHHRCHVAADGLALTAHLPQTETPEVGAELDLRLKADSIVVLQDGAGVGQ
jgi:spermidine/putrescine transport system ATP-binding protein